MSVSKTLAIIQARTSSSRLPGKVLLDIGGQPMLAWAVERTRMAQTIDQVVVATTSEPDDDSIAEFCSQNDTLCYRGSLHDVLDRYYQAARAYAAGLVVRITADCPLIDPGVIDQTFRAFSGLHPSGLHPMGEADKNIRTEELGTRNEESPADTLRYDFAANRLPPPWGRTFPIGLDTEVCTFQGLEIAWKEADQPHQREHVMPFFYDHPQRFRTLLVNYKQDYGSMRWTVDTAEDLELVRRIADHFSGRHDFSWLEVVELFQRRPELAEINARVQHKDYRQVDERRGGMK